MQDKLLADLDRQATSESSAETAAIDMADSSIANWLDVSVSGTEEQGPAEPEVDLESEPGWVPGNAEKAVKEYENLCPLLAQTVRERLSHCRGERESQLSWQIELAETRLRGLYEGLERVKGKRKREATETALRHETTAIRDEIVGVAMTVAGDGVREFANGLLVSQGKLGVHANWLRGYTASLVNEIRNRLNTSQVLQIIPLLPWRQDPLTQKAIQTCEETIAERKKIGDRWPYGTGESSGSNPDWSAVVQEWEAFKAANKIEFGPRERLPESVLRTILSSHYGIMPKDVDWEQIRQAGADLCRHYGPVLVVPLELETNDPLKAAPDSKATAQFWKEREDEFRKHDTPGNCTLSAVWFSTDDRWIFQSGSGTLSSAPEQIFKPLAREAAKGLTGSRSAEPWVDWLYALLHARDRSTGTPLYSKVSTTGTRTIGERELERMAKLGEPVPRGGLIEFVVPHEREGDPDQANESGFPLNNRAEKRMVWDTTTQKIECLFTSSANFCLELRSRAPCPEETSRPQQLPEAPVMRGGASPEPTLEANSGEAAPAQEATVANSGHRTNRTAVVDDFLLRCNQESAVGFKVIRKHIWLAAGHRHARQFQYWQEGSDKATDEDDRNFRRILSTPPAEFMALLKKKNIGS